MAYIYDRHIEHLLRRASFGARPDERDTYGRLAFTTAIDRLIDYDDIPDTVDDKIPASGFLQTRGSSGAFSPRTVITDARQRWLFRMVHSDRPLQEKMTLFWHNHFATAYSKLVGILPSTEATRYLASKPEEDPARVRGQIEMLRANALGNFEQILLEIAKDTAMMYWLDGRLNTRDRPQENFAREIMELFTMGVGHYTEPDVYAAARVFTGWNLASRTANGSQYFEFVYNANQHETTAKSFSFDIYPDGGRTIPARAAAQGMQDGLDFIAALARHPQTVRYLATKLYRFFVSESGDVSDAFVDRIANVYLKNQGNMRIVMREVLRSPEFWDEPTYFSRFSWPAEFVARIIKEIGWVGFSAFDALVPMGNMGQNLYDPPDVAGWDAGRGWFSTGSMLARMNFASALAANQRLRMVEPARSFAKTPSSLVSYVLDRLVPETFDPVARQDLVEYLRSSGTWPVSRIELDAKLAIKLPGLFHLVAGSAEYQLDMKVTRRQFVQGGVTAFTVTFAAPEFLGDLARAQGAHVRNLVVLYLSGGNDALSMLVPYGDPFYYSRRPNVAVPAANVLQIGTDAGGSRLGLHPRLTGLRQIFDRGNLALIQRTGYPGQSRSHFQGTDIWSTADPGNSTGLGWVGKYLDSLPSPVDALVGWNTTRDLPRVLLADHVAVPAIPSAAGYAFNSPNTQASEISATRTAATRISSHVPVDRPSLAFVYDSVQAALATIDRVATVGSYQGSLGAATYPNTPFSQALRAVAGSMVRGIGTRVFYVTTGGFDTHAQQNVNNGTYFNLMATFNDGLLAFSNDLSNQALWDDTLVLTFSEFGRRIDENGSAGTDHGAATVMMALGGRVSGGLYGTATSLRQDAANPALENNGNDISFQTDFRSVYARVLDNWLGADSQNVLGGNFRNAALTFV